MTGSPEAAEQRGLRREIYALHGEVVAYGKRTGFERLVNSAQGEILRCYLEADKRTLDTDGDSGFAELQLVRHQLLCLRRQLIEAVNNKCRKTLDEMSGGKYDSEVVRQQLGTPDLRKSISEVGGFLAKTEGVQGDWGKFYESMSNAGEMGDKAANNLDMMLGAHTAIKTGTQAKAEAEKAAGWTVARATKWLVGAVAAGLISWLITRLLP